MRSYIDRWPAALDVLADRPPPYFAGVFATDLAAGFPPPGTARSRTSVSRI